MCSAPSELLVRATYPGLKMVAAAAATYVECSVRRALGGAGEGHTYIARSDSRRTANDRTLLRPPCRSRRPTDSAGTRADVRGGLDRRPDPRPSRRRRAMSRSTATNSHRPNCHQYILTITHTYTTVTDHFELASCNIS